MSAIWGWAQLAEHPEKCIRITPASSWGPERAPGRGAAPTGSPASCSSRKRAHLTARSLVSTMAYRQNSLPVQATTPRVKGPGYGEYFCIRSSANMASIRSSGTPVKVMFWSVPMRTVPSPYVSASRPASTSSRPFIRPTGTEQPT